MSPLPISPRLAMASAPTNLQQSPPTHHHTHGIRAPPWVRSQTYCCLLLPLSNQIKSQSPATPLPHNLLPLSQLSPNFSPLRPAYLQKPKHRWSPLPKHFSVLFPCQLSRLPTAPLQPLLTHLKLLLVKPTGLPPLVVTKGLRPWRHTPAAADSSFI